MDRTLVKKILGLEYFVKLEDTIYNLREITDDIRDSILFNKDIFYNTEIIDRSNYELNSALQIIKSILSKLENPDLIVGYTNSKEYLKKYVNSISCDIDSIQKAFLAKDEKLLVYHNNMLCDSILRY